MVTHTEFRKQAGTFFQLLPGSTQEQGENGFKQLTIAYLNMETSNEMEQYEAALIHQMAADKMITLGWSITKEKDHGIN